MFSSIYDEGTMDLPAMLDYVLNETRQESLYYIGYSMGTTTLFTLLSTKPQYNAKIKLAICFAPVALWTEIPPMLYELVNLIPIVKVKFINLYYCFLVLLSFPSGDPNFAMKSHGAAGSPVVYCIDIGNNKNDQRRFY